MNGSDLPEHRPRTGRPSRSLALLWAVLASMVVLVTWTYRAEVSNDAVQAIDGAEHLRRGDGYATSILFFDEHFRAGRLPVAQTVWPPGYPLLIAAGSVLGLPEEAAARLIPRIAFVLLVPLVFLAAMRLLGDRWLASAVTIWLLGVTELWLYLTAPNSDLPFTAALAGVVVLLPRADRPASWLWCSLLGALAVWLRYAGLFVMLALGLLVLADLWRNRALPGLGKLRAAWFALPGAVLAALPLMRNQLLVGNFQGGNAKPMSQSVTELARVTASSFADLLAGVTLPGLTGTPGQSGPAALGLIAIGLAALGALLGIRVIARRRPGGAAERYAAQIAVIAAVYVGLVFFTATRSMISYGSRLLLPVVPLVLLLVVWGVALWRAERGTEGRARHLIPAALAALLIAQLAAVPKRWDSRVHELPSDPSVLAWIRTHIAPNQVILAVGDGQRLGYFAQRSTVVVAPARWTAQRWDEPFLRCIVHRYQVHALLVSPGLREADYPPFMLGLAAGHPPTWLDPVQVSPKVRGYLPAEGSAATPACGRDE